MGIDLIPTVVLSLSSDDPIPIDDDDSRTPFGCPSVRMKNHPWSFVAFRKPNDDPNFHSPQLGVWWVPTFFHTTGRVCPPNESIHPSTRPTACSSIYANHNHHMYRAIPNRVDKCDIGPYIPSIHDCWWNGWWNGWLPGWPNPYCVKLVGCWVVLYIYI
jgi:hypothetical protein